MRGVNPAIEAAPKRSNQPVRVSVVADGSQYLFHLVSFPIPIGILVKGYIGQAQGNNPLLVRIKPNRDIQPIGESADSIRASVSICIFQNPNLIPAFHARLD